MVIKLKKRYILILSFIVLLLSVSSVNAGLFDFLGFGPNIELTDETTSGICTIYDDTGRVYTTYYINGVLKGLPDNLRDYNLKSSIYDENGKLVGEYDDIVALEWIAESSKNNEPAMIGFVTIDDFKNVSVYELKIYNPDGEMIFEDNVTFSMDKMSFDHYNESDIDDGKIKIEKFESYVEIYSDEGSPAGCSISSAATIENCPSDMEDYVVKTTYFDKNHNKIGETKDDLEDIVYTDDENEDTAFCEFGYYATPKGDTTKYAVMSILLYDEELVNSTYELNEKDISTINVDYDDSDSSTDSDTSDDSSSSNGVTPHFRTFTDEENRKFEYYYDKYLADNG